MYGPPSTPLLCARYHTPLVMAISRKGQGQTFRDGPTPLETSLLDATAIRRPSLHCTIRMESLIRFTPTERLLCPSRVNPSDDECNKFTPTERLLCPLPVSQPSSPTLLKERESSPFSRSQGTAQEARTDIYIYIYIYICVCVYISD